MKMKGRGLRGHMLENFLDLPQMKKSLVGLNECEVRARNEFDWGVVRL